MTDKFTVLWKLNGREREHISPNVFGTPEEAEEHAVKMMEKTELKLASWSVQRLVLVKGMQEEEFVL